jgi:ribose transport system permease protein
MSSCIFGALYLHVGFNFFLALLLGILSGTLAGTISGTLSAKGDIPPFIATLGMMGIAQGIALVITAGYSLYQFPEAFLYMAHGELLGIPIPMLIVAAVYVAMYFVVEYTRLGRYAYAIGGNESAAELSGVAVDKCKIMIFALNGFLAALAGVVMTARNASAHPGLGTGFELDAIAAVVIGGTSLAGGEGTIIGTIIGALIMAVIKNSLNLLGVSPFIQRIAIGSVIILAVLLDSASKRRALKITKA